MNKTIFDISFLDFSIIIINYDVYTSLREALILKQQLAEIA